MEKITKEELLSSPEFWEENIKSDLFELIHDYMEKNKHSRSSLAKEIGVSKGYISQVLNGDSDHRLSKIVQLALAIGRAPYFYFKDIEKVLEADKRGDSIYLDFEKMESKAKRCDQRETDIGTRNEYMSFVETMEDISSEDDPNNRGSATVNSFKKNRDRHIKNTHCPAL